MTTSDGSSGPDDGGLHRVLSAVAAHWDELPEWFGDGWPGAAARIATLVDGLADSPDGRRRMTVALELAALLGAHPALDAVVDVEDVDVTRGPWVGEPTLHALRPTDAADLRRSRWRWSVAIAWLRDRIAVAQEERYTDVVAPGALLVDQREVLTVRLTRTELAARVLAESVAVPSNGTFTVRLNAPTDLVAVEGDAVESINGAADGSTAVFHLTGRAPGRATIVVDLLHRHHVVKTIRVPLEVVATPPGRPRDPVTARALVSAGTGPVDVDLRIYCDDRPERPVLRFVVNSRAAGLHHYDAGETPMREPPRDYRQRLLRQLLPGTERSATSIGQQMWRELVPEGLRSAYQHFRGQRTLQITSDEPWIPWELLCPYEQQHGTTGVDDEPWCLRFDLTRWLAGDAGLPAEVRVSSGVVVDAGAGASLPGAAKERREVEAFLDRTEVVHRGIDAAGVGSTSEVFAAWGEIADLWHMVGHGDADGIVLAGGRRMRPEEIVGPVEAALASKRPLVVLNACRTGEQDWGIGGLRGWPEVLVRRCGATFVGTLWAVTDEVAATVVTTFYRQLDAGIAVGGAMREARRRCLDAYPGDPSPLAYVVYGHPDQTVSFGP